MADYKVVNVEKLETELTEVAEEVRILADTQEKMSINKMTENVAQANDTIEVQKDIILEIKATLEGKASGSKEEQEKTLSIIENGNYEILPDENKTLSKVSIEANIALGEDIGKPYIDTSKITDFSYFFGNNARLDLLENIDTSIGTSFSYMFYNSSLLKNVPLFDTSNGTNFSYMFCGCRSWLFEIPPLDTSNAINFDRMFYDCFSLEQVPLLNSSKVTNFAYMFHGCTRLETFPLSDTSNGTNFSNMCYGCNSIEDIPLLDIRNSTTGYYGTFYNCTKLKRISLTTTNYDFQTNTFQNCTALTDVTIGEGWAVNIYLHYSNNLSVESLHGMIENLADLTGKTAKTFQIGSTNLAKIDEEHLTMLQNKNWNYL